MRDHLMQTQAVIQGRGFIIYEFQVLSDNPVAYEFLVKNRIKNTRPTVQIWWLENTWPTPSI